MDAPVLRSIYGYSYYNLMLDKNCSSCGDKALCRTICP